MLNNFKKKLASYIVNYKFSKRDRNTLQFKNFINNTKNYLFILPEEDELFNHSFTLINHFMKEGKIITLFILDYKYSLIPEQNKFYSITYSENDKNKLNLPRKELIEKIRKKSYDVVLDLNLNPNEFSQAVSTTAKTTYRIGFLSELNEKYFNFCIKKEDDNPLLSYKTMLDSLKMF